MTRIVTTQHRYKRPPKKKRPVAIEVPEVVTVRHRKRVAKADRTSEAEAGSEAASSSAPKDSAKAKQVPANDDRKAAIVTAKTPTKIREERRRAEEAEWAKESPRFQQDKPKAIVTGRKEARFPASAPPRHGHKRTAIHIWPSSTLTRPANTTAYYGGAACREQHGRRVDCRSQRHRNAGRTGHGASAGGASRHQQSVGHGRRVVPGQFLVGRADVHQMAMAALMPSRPDRTSGSVRC